jgi:hypothetical protein
MLPSDPSLHSVWLTCTQQLGQQPLSRSTSKSRSQLLELVHSAPLHWQAAGDVVVVKPSAWMHAGHVVHCTKGDQHICWAARQVAPEHISAARTLVHVHVHMLLVEQCLCASYGAHARQAHQRATHRFSRLLRVLHCTGRPPLMMLLSKALQGACRATCGM